MKSKNIITLIIVAILLGGGAILSSRKNVSDSNTRRGELLLEGIALDDIAKVTIQTRDANKSTITKTEDGWVVSEKNNYPANFDRLHNAIIALSKTKIENTIIVTEKQKKDMSIDSSSERIELTDASNKTLIEIILGDMREGGSAVAGPYGSAPTGRYISVDGGKTVIVVPETLYSFSNSSPKNWIDTELVNIPSSDIKTIQITAPNQEPISISRDENMDKLVVEGIKENQQVVSAKLNSIENALSYARFDDIAPSNPTKDELGFDNPYIFEAVTTNDTKYTITLGNKAGDADNRYAQLAVSYISDENDNKEANDNTNQDRINAETINNKVSGWTYIIPSYKVSSFIVSREDLLEEISVNEENSNNNDTTQITEDSSEENNAVSTKIESENK